MSKKSIPIFLLSNSSNSLLLDTTRKNSFITTLDNPVEIPEKAKNVSVAVRQASIVNFFYNISSTLNNNVFYFTDNQALPQKYTITIPNGAYEVSQLNAYIQTWLLNNTFTSTDLTLIENIAEQRVIISLGAGRGVQIPTNFGKVIGFNAQTIFNSSAGVLYYTGNNVANFNNVISLCVDTSLTISNLYNGRITQLGAICPINVPVSSILLYNPENPIRIGADYLVNNNISQITITILDQNRVPVEIIDNFSVLLEIEYDL